MGPTTGNMPSPGDPEIIEALKLSAETSVPVAFHAENWELVEYCTRKALEEHGETPLTHLYSRPPICEEEAVRRLILYTRITGGKNTNSTPKQRGGSRGDKRGEAQGINIYAETTPHYLLLDSIHYTRYGAAMKVNPPIRGPRHGEALWRAVLDGTITNLGSDHAPHADHEKNTAITKAASGFTAARTLLPLMNDQALRGKTTPNKTSRTSINQPREAIQPIPIQGNNTAREQRRHSNHRPPRRNSDHSRETIQQKQNHAIQRMEAQGETQVHDTQGNNSRRERGDNNRQAPGQMDQAKETLIAKPARIQGIQWCTHTLSTEDPYRLIERWLNPGNS